MLRVENRKADTDQRQPLISLNDITGFSIVWWWQTDRAISALLAIKISTATKQMFVCYVVFLYALIDQYNVHTQWKIYPRMHWDGKNFTKAGRSDLAQLQVLPALEGWWHSAIAIQKFYRCIQRFYGKWLQHKLSIQWPNHLNLTHIVALMLYQVAKPIGLLTSMYSGDT